MPTDNESSHRIVEVVMGGIALVGAAISAIWYAARSLAHIEAVGTATHDAVKDNAALNTAEHAVLTGEQVSIRVSISEQGRLLIRLIDEGSQREHRISKLEEHERGRDK